MQILSKSTVVDDNTLDLFGGEAEEVSTTVSPSPEKAMKPSPKPIKLPVRKSVQDYAHDESVDGIRDKYTNTSQGIDGYEDSIFLPNGEEVTGIWRLVDAFSVSPSHDPFTFHSTKGFPQAGGGASANTRDYANERDAQLQVVQLAGEFDGRALGFDTAVVVTKDGVVISGNNRTMSSQLAARKGTDKKYIEALMKRCRSFGFTTEQVQAFEHPRVVFEIDSQDYSPEHFDKYNQSDKKEQSEEARIIKFSKVVKPNVLRDIADLASRYQFDLGAVFAVSATCEELWTILIKNKVISHAELPKYFDGNKVSSAGKQFLYEYILGGVLSEPVVRGLYADNMGNLKQNVLGSVQLLLQNWACGSYSVIDELNMAIRYAIAFSTDVSNSKFVVPKIDKETAKTMSSEDKVAHNMKAFNVWASQGDLLEDRHPLVLKLAGALVFSASLFKDYLTRLNEATASAAKAEREKEEAGNAGLFGDDYVPDRNGLLEKAVASWQRRNLVKMNILSSVLRGDLMRNNTVVKSQAVFSDLKDKIMKWTAQSPENKKAYQQAMNLFRENFGKNPQSEKDAKVIMKTAQQMAKTGQVYSADSFKQAAQQVMNDGGSGQQAQERKQSTQGQSQGQSSGGVSSQDPVALFKAIQALYKSGSISKEQVDKAFAMVTGGQQSQKQNVYNMPDQTQGNDQQQEPLAASFNPVKSSGKNPGVVFDRLPKGVTGFQIGSRVLYTSSKLSGSLPVAVEDTNALYSGKEGIIKSISSEIYNVEMPEDGEIVSAYGDELEPVLSEEITSARGLIKDPMQEYVQQFLSNIPTLTKVPTDHKDSRIVKEKLAPDHVCYWYSETIDNGKSYTVEFHVSPGEPFCDVYVTRNFDNTPLDKGGYHIEDFEDWNLSEVDYVEGLFAKEKASTGKEGSFARNRGSITPYEVDEDDPYLADRVSAGFSQWSARVAAGLSLGKGLSLPDMAIVSGLARILSGGEQGNPNLEREVALLVAYGQDEDSSPEKDLKIEEDLKALGWGSEYANELACVAGESGGDEKAIMDMLNYLSYDEPDVDWPDEWANGNHPFKGMKLRSSFEDGFNKTLTKVDDLTHNPLKAIDDVVALPFKFLDKVTGKR